MVGGRLRIQLFHYRETGCEGVIDLNSLRNSCLLAAAIVANSRELAGASGLSNTGSVLKNVNVSHLGRAHHSSRTMK